MLEKFGCHVLIRPVGFGDFEAISSIFRQYMAIQLVPSACSSAAPTGNHVAAVEHADVVQAQKPTLEHVVALCVFAVHPPRKIQQQFLEYALQKIHVAGAGPLGIEFIDRQARPCMNGRIHVAKRPFVGR